MRALRAPVLASILAPVLLLAACGRAGPQPLLGTLERDRIEVTSDYAEPIIDIPVAEGDRVAAGDVLVRLKSVRQDARVAEGRANRDAASARLAELVRGPRQEAIDEARAALERADAALERADSHYRRIDKLRDDKLVSQSELDEALADRNASRAQRNEAAARLDSLLDGTTSEELDRARADLRAAEAHLEMLEYERSLLTLRAPVDGWVDSLPYQKGERVPAGATVAVTLAAGAPYARIYLPETLRAKVAPGQAALVHIDGRPDPLPARVRFVSGDAAFTPFFALTEKDRGRLAYLTEVEISDPDGLDAAAGMPVEVNLPGLE